MYNNEEVSVNRLLFDGSNIGTYDNLFDLVRWCQPFFMQADANVQQRNQWFYAQIVYQEKDYYVWLRGFSTKSNTTAAVIDEAKAIFGMKKFGTHTFKAKQKLVYQDGQIAWLEIATYYLIYKAKYQYINLSMNGNDTGQTIQFLVPETVTDDLPATEEYLRQLQEIVIFREIIGIHHRPIDSLFLLQGTLYSIDLSIAGNIQQIKRISQKQNTSLFPSLHLRQEITESMLQIDADGYEERLLELGNQLLTMLDRVDRTKIHYTSMWMENIRSRMDIYNKLKENYLN